LIQSSASSEVIALRNRQSMDLWRVQLLDQHPPFAATGAGSGNGSSSSKNGSKNGSKNDVATTVSSAAAVVGSESSCQLMLRVQLKGSEHLQCSALSASGGFLGVSSSNGIRLYELCGAASTGSSAKCTVKKIDLPDLLRDGREFAHAMVFSEVSSSEADAASASTSSSGKKRSNSKTTIGAAVSKRTYFACHCARKGVIVVCEIVAKAGSIDDSSMSSYDAKVCFVVDHKSIVDSRLGSMEKVTDVYLSQAVRKMVVSAGGRYLAVCSCSTSSIVYVYDVVKQKLHWILPVNSSTVTDLVFRAASNGDEKDTSLVVLTAANMFRVYDVANLQLNAWSEANEAHYPDYIMGLNAPLCGVALDSSSSSSTGSGQNRLLLFGQGHCVHVDLSKALVAGMKASVGTGEASTKLLKSSMLGNNSKKHSKKRGRGEIDEEAGNVSETEDEKSGNGNFIVFNKYRNLLQVQYLNNNQLVRDI
jgi:hypothetical protein